MARFRNKDIKKELKVNNLNERIIEYRGRWKEYVGRMAKDRLSSRAMNYTLCMYWQKKCRVSKKTMGSVTGKMPNTILKQPNLSQ